MNTLTHCELKQVVAGVLPRNHFHHQTKPQVGIRENVIAGLLVEGIVAIVGIIYERFTGGKKDSKKDSDTDHDKDKDKDQGRDRRAQYGFSMGMSF